MELGQIFTKSNIADYMISLFTLNKDSKILDPCFGGGALLDSLSKQGFNNIDGYEIDSDLYNQTKKNIKYKTLLNEDFLLNKSKVKYDGVVMNPPYIRHEKIDELKELGVTKSILRQIPMFSRLPSTANLYMYFIVKALSMIRDDGEMVVIFPSSWLTTKAGLQFKGIIYESSTLIQEIHLSGELFEKKALVEVLVLHLKKGKFDSLPLIKSYKVINKEFNEIKEDNSNVDLGFKNEFINIASIRRGLTTGYNEMFMNPVFNSDNAKKHVKKIISSPKSITGYSSKNAKLEDILIINNNQSFSKEVNEYIDKFKNIIIKNKKPKTLYNKIIDNKEWFKLNSIDSTGIIFNYFVRNDMKFIYNKENLVRDNFYIIKPKINSYFMFALLNNYYTYFQLEKLGKKYGGGLLKIQKYDIESLLFPDINKFTKDDIEKIIKISQKIINENYKNGIKQISDIISKYSEVNSLSIEESLNYVIAQRLKEK